MRIGDGIVLFGLTAIVAVQLGSFWWIVLVLYLLGALVNAAAELVKRP